MLRLTLCTGPLLLISLIFVNSASAGYDPEVCRTRLANQGFPACPLKSANCHEVADGALIHEFCSSRDVYAPVALNMVEDPKTREKKMFKGIQETINFLREHPDYQIKQCYCFC